MNRLRKHDQGETRTTPFPEARLSSYELRSIQVASAPNRSLKPAGLLALAASPLECAIATVLLKLPSVPVFARMHPVDALFRFRAVMVPQLCHLIIRQAIQTYSGVGTPLWLFEHASYVVASKRAQAELLLLIVTKDGVREPGQPPGEFERWLGTAGGHLFRLHRNDAWRKAALRSARYWLKKQSRYVSSPDAFERKAALLTVMQKLSGPLPSDLFGHMEQSFDTARLKRVRWSIQHRASQLTGLSLDSWIYEVWPLVQHYHWTHGDLRRVIDAKADACGDPIYLTAADKTSRISERCRKLGLRLSSKAQEPVGRPAADDLLPFPGALAVDLNSFHQSMADWLAGDPDDLPGALRSLEYLT